MSPLPPLPCVTPSHPDPGLTGAPPADYGQSVQWLPVSQPHTALSAPPASLPLPPGPWSAMHVPQEHAGGKGLCHVFSQTAGMEKDQEPPP